MNFLKCQKIIHQDCKSALIFFSGTSDSSIDFFSWSLKITFYISLPGKFYVFAVVMYFILGRIFWILLTLLKSDPTLSSQQISTVKLVSSVERAENKSESKLNILQNRAGEGVKVHKKKRAWHHRNIKYRKQKFELLDKWSTDPGMKKVLLWTGRNRSFSNTRCPKRSF